MPVRDSRKRFRRRRKAGVDSATARGIDGHGVPTALFLNRNLAKLPRSATNSDRRFRTCSAFKSSASHAKSNESQPATPLAKIQDHASRNRAGRGALGGQDLWRQPAPEHQTLLARERSCASRSEELARQDDFGVTFRFTPRLTSSIAVRVLTASMKCALVMQSSRRKGTR